MGGGLPDRIPCYAHRYLVLPSYYLDVPTVSYNYEHAATKLRPVLPPRPRPGRSRGTLDRADRPGAAGRPPPAAAAVYELTPRGRNLLPALMVLADWGAADLAQRRPTDALRAHWFAIPLMRRIAELAAPCAGVVEVRLDEGTFHILLNDSRPAYAHGPAEQPDAQLIMDARSCLALTQGAAPLNEMIKKGEASVAGDSPLADALRNH